VSVFQKRYFSKLLDADTGPHAVADDRFISGQNIRFGTTDKGHVGYFENVLGNTLIANDQLPGTGSNIVIGACSDDSNGYKIAFVWNSLGHHVITLLDRNGNFWSVLKDTNVTGGLNFSKYALIHCFVEAGILYFNDALNQPRRVNLMAAIYGNHTASPDPKTFAFSFPIAAEEITVIRQPPAYAPSVQKLTDGGVVNNYIANDSYQAAYKYSYYDGETSVLSTWSVATKTNFVGDTYNSVKIDMNTADKIPQSVKIVELWIRSQATGKFRKIRSWDRSITADNTAINNHNTGVTLTYTFYNDVTGIVLSDTEAYTPYSDVPRLSKSMTIGKNRLLMLNNLKGYDTPVKSSLTATGTVATAGGSRTVSFGIIKHTATTSDTPGTYWGYSAYYCYLTDVVPAGYYVITASKVNHSFGSDPWGSLAPSAALPGSVAFSGLEYIGNNTGAAETNTMPVDYVTDRIDIADPSGTATVTSWPAANTLLFKSSSPYKIGIVFYDQYLRKCGVWTKEALKVSTPGRAFSLTSYSGGLSWTLSNTDAVNEIPDWAYYYSIVRTLNLKTRYFIQALDNAMQYGYKDAAGVYTAGGTTWTGATTAALMIDTTGLLQDNLGYVFNEGDICIITESGGTQHELPVITQQGKYIIVAAKNIGSLAVNFVYEVYTPYKPSDDEPFYEVGAFYKINSPTLSGRTYSILSGSLPGDISQLSRTVDATTYDAEAMCPNDKYFQRWDTDAGRLNIVTPLGQVRLKTELCFSDVIIEGSYVNGLSSFQTLNSEILPFSIGEGQKLQMTSKMEKLGSVLLVIGDQGTLSIYLGEVQMFDSVGNSSILKSDKFIGQINDLRGAYGTINPESVVEYKGEVYWADLNNDVVIRYASNGLYPISEFGIKRAFRLFSQKYKTLDTATIEGFGCRPFVFGGFDTYHNDYLLSIPSTEASAPKGSIADADVPFDYPYDLYDGQAKVLAFKMGTEQWAMPYSYRPEFFLGTIDRLYTFKNGQTYRHSESSLYNVFHGEYHKSRICFVCRSEDAPSAIKTWLNIAIESNIAPTYTHFRTEFPADNTGGSLYQSSDLVQSDYRMRENRVFEAAILRDRTSPNVSGTADQKLLTGDKMRGAWVYVMLEWDTNSLLQIRFINVGHSKVAGHNNI